MNLLRLSTQKSSSLVISTSTLRQQPLINNTFISYFSTTSTFKATTNNDEVSNLIPPSPTTTTATPSSSSTSTSSTPKPSSSSTSSSDKKNLSPKRKPFMSKVVNQTILELQATPPSPSSRSEPEPDWVKKFKTNKDLKTNFFNEIAGDASNKDYIPRLETAQDRWERATGLTYPSPLTTLTARSLPVVNFNVAFAYRRLNRTLQENNLRREVKRQERFESKSNKRVRLDSERHRRRFKIAVGKSVSMSMRMKQV